jgi:hypothetical protein
LNCGRAESSKAAITVDDGTVRQIDKRFDNVRILLIERLLATAEQANSVIGFDRDGAIAVNLLNPL